MVVNRKVTSFSMSGDNLDVYEKGVEILKREDLSLIHISEPTRPY